jgi:hypothetical protein
MLEIWRFFVQQQLKKLVALISTTKVWKWVGVTPWQLDLMA